MFNKYECGEEPGSTKMKPGFEGSEKSLHIIFEGRGESLLSISEERWSNMLELANCSILSSIGNKKCRAYVLSESSLFVYDKHILIKTCGTTRLLNSLDDALYIGRTCGLQPHTVFYARKNYTFPELQPTPHTKFVEECEFLDSHLKSAKSTHSETAGPEDGDHWCYYTAKFVTNDGYDEEYETNLSEHMSLFEIKMHEIDPQRASMFFERENWTGKQVTHASGISQLIPGQRIDEHLFSPCGYSMNGLLEGGWYSTIHVTPEEHCSYVSFETNLPLSNTRDASKLLSRVLDIFRPATFSVMFLGNQCSNAFILSSENNRVGVDYSLCWKPASVQLGDDDSAYSLPIVMLSYSITDIALHSLGNQALCRLSHLARYSKDSSSSPSAISMTASASSSSLDSDNDDDHRNQQVLVVAENSVSPSTDEMLFES